MTNQKSPVRAIEISPVVVDNKGMNETMNTETVDPWAYTPKSDAELTVIRESLVRSSYAAKRRSIRTGR